MAKIDQVIDELAKYAQVVSQAFDDEDDVDNRLFHLGRLATIARILGFLKHEARTDELKNWYDLEKMIQSLNMPGEPAANSRRAWIRFTSLFEMYLADRVGTENEIFRTSERIDTPCYDIRYAIKREEFKDIITCALR